MGLFTEYDLIQAISGTDEFGHSKCSISINLERQDADGNLKKIDDEFVSEKPVVQVFKQAGGFVLVDFIFDDINDMDLHIIYSYLKKFFDSTQSVSDDDLDFPVLSVAIVPNDLQGEYWVLGNNPIFYALTPDDEKGEPRIIRMAFIQQEDKDVLPNFLFLTSLEEELEKIGDEEDVDLY